MLSLSTQERGKLDNQWSWKKSTIKLNLPSLEVRADLSVELFAHQVVCCVLRIESPVSSDTPLVSWKLLKLFELIVTKRYPYRLTSTDKSN